MKFEANKKYECRSICNYNCIWKFEVVKRTSKYIIISDGEEQFRCKIYNDKQDNSEFVYPLGHYSMCPVLRAKNAA
ncbi:MAG: hypothetical protein J1E81_07330 [Eubacterium sp.]|nr:hypothetical protein [Eubacterium sp.]